MKSHSLVVYPLLLLSFLLFMSGADTATAKPGTFHIFPQIADDVQEDGTTYVSLTYVTNLNYAPTSCTLSLFGLSESRLVAASKLIVPANSRMSFMTSGRERLACLQIVEYPRAILGGNVAFSHLGTLLTVSGAFGRFRRDAVGLGACPG